MVPSLTLLKFVEYQLLVFLTEGFPHHYEQVGSRQGGQLGSLKCIYVGGVLCLVCDIVLLFYQYLVSDDPLPSLSPLTYLMAVTSHDNKNVKNVEPDVVQQSDQ